MLRITADVNGYPIGYIYVHNTGRHQCKTPDCGLWVYHAATWDPEKKDGLFGIEGIEHERIDGWEKLTQLVLEEMCSVL